MKGWYGDRHKHVLASRGIKTVNTNWRTSESAEMGMVAEVPIDWLWQFRVERGQLPSDWEYWSKERKEELEKCGGIDYIIESERENIEKIKREILEEGLRIPLQLHVGREDGKVILGEGNHRLVALKELGYTKVPVRVCENEFLFNGIVYENDISKTNCFPSSSSPLHVFPDLEGYTPHPLLQERDWKEEYR